jgi:hypothetical protein|tara:strand:- start:174 stop:551 length:378 start_codon:yes stop_codon:yes gene_type:complete
MSRLGIPNKNKKFLLARLQDIYGEQFHPIMKMADAASKLDSIAEEEGDVAALTASVNAWGKIAEYTEPKLKAVEIRADNSAVVAISRRRFDGGTDAIEAEVVEVDPVVEAIINAAIDDEDSEDEE